MGGYRSGASLSATRATEPGRQSTSSMSRSSDRPSPDTVLIVEDEDDIRELLAGLLEADGYRVLRARNGQEALALLHGPRRPCLIVLDLMMPVMDGRAFLRARRADPAASRLPVIIITAYGQDVDFAGLGAAGLVPKPFDLDALLAMVAAHCPRSGSPAA